MKFNIYFNVLRVLFICVLFHQPVISAEPDYMQSIFVLTSGSTLNPGEGLKAYSTQLFSYPDGHYAYSNRRSFNDLNPNRMFSHTFKSLTIDKKHIFDAQMSVCLKPLEHSTAISYNDTIELRFVNQSGSSVGEKWIRQIGTTRDEEGEVIRQGISPELWQHDPSNAISFKKEFDLSALPSADGISISLINDLNQLGYLDLIVQDETVVESVRLTLTYCNDNIIQGFMETDAIYPGENIVIDLIAQGTDVYTLSTTLLAQPGIISYSQASYGNFFPENQQHVTPVQIQPDGRIVASMGFQDVPEFIPRENWGAFVHLTFQSLRSYCGPVSIDFENIEFLGSNDQALSYEYEPIEFDILDDGIHCGKAVINGLVELPDNMSEGPVFVQISRNGKALTQMTDEYLNFEFTDLREANYEIQAYTNDYSSDPVLVFAFENATPITCLPLRKNNFCLSIGGSGPITVNGNAFDLPYTDCFARDSQIQLIAHQSFFQWTGDLESDQAAYTIVLNDDKVITAHYANGKISGNVALADGDPDDIITIIVSGHSNVYTSIIGEDSTFVFSQLRQGEYQIQAIAGDFSSDSRTITLHDDDHVHEPIMLSLRKNEYTLELSGLGKVILNDSLQELPYSDTFERDSEISLKALTHFIRWSGDIESNLSQLEFTLDTDQTISVHYANGSISGKIILSDGEPSDDITIKMKSSEEEYLAQANSQRNYSFNHILPGTYEIQALAVDFSSYSQMVSVSEQGSKLIDLELRKNEYQLSISGSGNITINHQSCSLPYARKFSRDSKVFLNANNNFIQWSGDIDDKTTKSCLLDMNQDRQISVLYAEGLVTGTIALPDGIPQDSIKFNLSCGANTLQTTADHNNAFTFIHLRQCEYHIQAVTQKFSSDVKQITLENNNDHKTAHLSLRKKDYILSIDGTGIIFIDDNQFSLPYSDVHQRDSQLVLNTTDNFIKWEGSISGEQSPFNLMMNNDQFIIAHYARGAVSGSISYPEGTPYDSLKIQLTNDENQYHIQTEQNQYSFSSIKKGTYDIYAYASGFSSDRETIIIEDDQSKTHELIIRKNSYSLYLNGSGEVRVNGNTTSLPYFTTFPRKTSIVLEAGEHFVRWKGDLASEISPYTLLMDGDKNIQVEYARGEISGTVDYPDGTPSNPVIINLKRSEDSIQQVSPDQNNKYLFQGLREGSYQLWATSNGFSSDSMEINLLKDEKQTIAIKLRKDQYLLTISGLGTVIVNGLESDLPFDDMFQRDLSVTIQGPENFIEWDGDEISTSNPHTFILNTNKQITACYARGEIKGSISIKDENPLTDVTIQLTNDHFEMQKGVNPDMSFNFTGIRAGVYQIYAFSNLFSTETKEITIIDDQITAVTLSLRKNAYALHVEGCGPIVMGNQSYSLPHTQTFARDQEIVLSPPSSFLSWSGDYSGTEKPLSVLMDSDKNIQVKCNSINWQAMIQATAEDEFTSDIIIGVAPSEKFIEIMPMPIDFSVQMALRIPEKDPEWYYQYIQEESPVTEPYMFTFIVNPAGTLDEEKTAVLSWHPENFYQDNNWFYILREVNGNILLPNMRLTKQLPVTGVSQNYQYAIEVAPYVYYNLEKGWNLISLCVSSESSVLTELFSDAIAAFKYDETYEQVTNLYPSEGYWIKLETGGTYVIPGTSFDSYRINLKRGWNLVGSINIDKVIPVTDPPGMIEYIFAFDDFYYKCSSLRFGKGYWIKALEDCTLYVEPKN